MCLNECRNPREFRWTEAVIVRLSHRHQPELRHVVVSPHVNARRFVTITRKEKEPIRAATKHGWIHGRLCSSVPPGRTRGHHNADEFLDRLDWTPWIWCTGVRIFAEMELDRTQVTHIHQVELAKILGVVERIFHLARRRRLQRGVSQTARGLVGCRGGRGVMDEGLVALAVGEPGESVLMPGSRLVRLDGCEIWGDCSRRTPAAVRCRIGRPHRGCQPAGLVAVRETGLMWANMLRAFQVGKALTSDGRPSSWMRPSRVAWAQVSWPACHLTKASASAVM
jgi:hypothetical protein